MKILITGGSGFVASYLVKQCLDKGDEVVVTLRWNEDLSRIQPYLNKVKVEYVELTDLSSVIRVINKHRPDIISHLAAQSWVPYSMSNPIFTMKNNIESTLNILEAVRIIREISERIDNSFRKIDYNPLIHICSSSEFYGKVDIDKLPITEEHKANPGNVYGVSKTAGDFLAQLYSTYYDLRVLITRFFTHTGAGRTMPSAEVFYAKVIAEIEAGKRDKKIPIGNMESIRTWANVKDAVKAYYELFKNNKTGIYNVGGDVVRPIKDVLDYMLSISKLNKDEIEIYTDQSLLRKIDVDVQIINLNKLKSEIDWKPNITFEETMADILNFWRKQNELEK